MATPDQISAFSGQWLPYAQQAGTSLGVDPNLILAQWGLESGYGTSSTMGNNVGGLMPSGSLGNYATPADFVNAYVGTIENGFPAALNTGSDANAFVSGLANGNSGSYFGTQSPQSYLSSLTGTEANLTGSAPSDPCTSGSFLQKYFNTGCYGNPQQIATGQAQPITATDCNGASGILTGACWARIGGDVAFVVLGVGVVFFAVASGLFGGPKQVVSKTARAATVALG